MEQGIFIPLSIVSSTKIGHAEKILYAQILSLSKKDGFCWASNAHLAESIGVSTRTIIRSLRILCEEGFITCEYKNLVVDGDTKTNRKINITQEKTQDVKKNKTTKYSYSQKISSLKNEIDKKSRRKTAQKTAVGVPNLSWVDKNGGGTKNVTQVIYNTHSGNAASGNVSSDITKNLPSGGLQIFSKSADTTKSNNVKTDQSDEKDHRKAVKVIGIFSAITPTYEAMFAIPAQRKAAIALYDALGSDGVMSLVSDFVKYRDRQYAPMVGSVTDFLRLLGKIQQFVEKEKRVERKDYNVRGNYKAQTPTIRSKSTNPFYKRAEGSI